MVVVVLSGASDVASASLQAIDSLFLTQLVSVFQYIYMIPVSAVSGVNVGG